MKRVYLSAEDVSEAILNAGMELRPEDCLVTKFGEIAQELSDKARSRVRAEISEFVTKVLY
jgi:hypothetical protein